VDYDAKAIAELVAVADVSVPHTVSHYLYVPNKKAADVVAKELRRRGFRTEERLGADGLNWLVLSQHEVVPSDDLMATTRSVMEALADEVDGEYDGWEVEVRR
jgi:hypothetical protein